MKKWILFSVFVFLLIFFISYQKQPNDDVSKSQEKQQTEKIAPIAQIFANMMSSAKDEFKKGDADSGVIKILQALQLMTPRTK